MGGVIVPEEENTSSCEDDEQCEVRCPCEFHTSEDTHQRWQSTGCHEQDPERLHEVTENGFTHFARLSAVFHHTWNEEECERLEEEQRNQNSVEYTHKSKHCSKE